MISREVKREICVGIQFGLSHGRWFFETVLKLFTMRCVDMVVSVHMPYAFSNRL